MKQLRPAVVLLLASLGVAHAQQPQTPAAATSSASTRSSYDPMARENGAAQPNGIVETTLAGVNPRDKDYGAVVAGWRKEVFENTIDRVYFWGLLALGLGLGCSLAANGWFLNERERRLVISVDVVTQLFNAYIGSRAKALEVIAKYNALVDRYNRLDGERQQLKDQIAKTATPPSASDLDYNRAREDRETALLSPSNPPMVPEEDAANLDGEKPEIEALRSQLAEYEATLQRKIAQLQAKDNQISNLRSRLTRAHDSLEGLRKQTTLAN